MPVDQTLTLEITCDNPNCPGHPDLDPADRIGWLFVTHEIYGEMVQQHVFGNEACVSAVTADSAVAQELGFVKKPVEEETPTEVTTPPSE